MKRRFTVSVIGGHKCDEAVTRMAEKAGRVIAEEGAVLVSGGLTGVMEASSRGASLAGGLVIGIIPGEDKNEANEHCEIVIPTGMGFTRNTLVAGTADLVVALPGEYGTLSEMAFSLVSRKRVLSLGAWDLPDAEPVKDPEKLRSILREEMVNRE